jgi:hypothetical protein
MNGEMSAIGTKRTFSEALYFHRHEKRHISSRVRLISFCFFSCQLNGYLRDES